jgi:hypothetical protein
VGTSDLLLVEQAKGTSPLILWQTTDTSSAILLVEQATATSPVVLILKQAMGSSYDVLLYQVMGT